MTPTRHHIVGSETEQVRPLAYVTVYARTKSKPRLGAVLASVAILALILLAGAVWLILGPAIMRAGR